MLSLVYHLYRKRCSFVLFLGRFVISTGGWQNISWIMWIYSPCIQKLVTIYRQKCRSISLDSLYPSECIFAPYVYQTVTTLTATNQIVIIQTWRGLKEQHQPFALVVWQGQNRLLHIAIMNMVPCGNSNWACYLLQHSGVVPMILLQTRISWPNITMLRIYKFLDSGMDHTMDQKVNKYAL